MVRSIAMPASRTTSIIRNNLVPVFLLMLMLVVMGLTQPAHSTRTLSVRRIAARHPHPLKTKHYHANHAFDVLPLEYHNGPVMRTTTTSYAIFWLPSTLQDGSATAVNTTYVSLITRYFGDIGGSGLYNTATQYY